MYRNLLALRYIDHRCVCLVAVKEDGNGMRTTPGDIVEFSKPAAVECYAVPGVIGAVKTCPASGRIRINPDTAVLFCRCRENGQGKASEQEDHGDQEKTCTRADSSPVHNLHSLSGIFLFLSCPLIVYEMQ